MFRSVEGRPERRRPDQQDLSDQLLRCQRGDESALAEFYDATAPRAWGLALRVVRDQNDAADVLKDAYRQLSRGRSHFDPSHNGAVSWFLAVVHGYAVKRVRSVEASPRSPAAGGETGTFDDLQRRAIELAYWSGYTHTQVAQILGIAVDTSAAYMRDGLRQLRQTGEA